MANEYSDILSLHKEMIQVYVGKIWTAERSEFEMEDEVHFEHLEFDMLVIQTDENWMKMS